MNLESVLLSQGVRKFSKNDRDMSKGYCCQQKEASTTQIWDKSSGLFGKVRRMHLVVDDLSLFSVAAVCTTAGIVTSLLGDTYR